MKINLRGGRRTGDITRQKILDFVNNFWGTNKRPPSFRDIQHGCNISSVSVVRHHLLRMRDMDMIDYESGVWGSVRPKNMRISFDGGNDNG